MLRSIDDLRSIFLIDLEIRRWYYNMRYLRERLDPLHPLQGTQSWLSVLLHYVSVGPPNFPLSHEVDYTPHLKSVYGKV